MLSDIISIEIFQKIFSYLHLKHSLKLINYNKSLQTKLSIYFNTYKENAIMYRAIDNNGKGKEYNIKTNLLKFEGEYKNKTRCGLGKEYSKGKLIFEGKYLNGLREGEGVEYFENCNIKFKGEYKNGNKKNGKGYNQKGDIIYEIKNGEGNIKEYNYLDKIEFEGEYKNFQYWTGKSYIYNDERNLKFEIIYVEGKINLMKEYDNNGDLIFELIENNKIKNGKEYKNNEVIF